MYRVLIVDDQKILRYDLRRINAWGDYSGFSIEGEAENGLEALEKLQKSPYDLVITDIRMPVMDGLDLLRKVSENKLCPCVVLLSDYTEFTYAREGLVHGAFDYMTKPLESQNLIALLARVKAYLDGRNQEIERLKHWENMAEEAYLPSRSIERVIQLIAQTQNEAMEAAQLLVDEVGAALDYNGNKVSIILKNAVEEIFTRVIQENEWIGMYTNPDELKQTDFGDNPSFESLRKKFAGVCQDLLCFLQKMIIWNGGNNTVKLVCNHVVYHIEEDVSVKCIAEKLYINKAYLSELFRQVTGLSLLNYITMVKVERAKFLLGTTSLKNYEISERLGFSDHEYFSKIFKKHTGFSPVVYRKENFKF